MRREPLAAHTKTKAPFPVSLLFEVKLFYWVALVIMVVSVAAGAFATTRNKGSSSTATPPPAEATETPLPGEGRQVKSYDAEPQMSIDTTKTYAAVIKTDKGDIRVELFASAAPHAVNSFVFLARDGFYDGLTFFRILPGFVAQAGDPTCTTDPTVTCTTSGGPGYFLTREDSGQSHEAGVLALAAPQGGEEVSGSQFYMTYAAETYLDGRDTVFGRVVGGQDVLDSLVGRDTVDPAAQPGDKILSIAIEET